MRSIDSLRAQTDQNWKAIIAFDTIEPTLLSDEKLKIIKVRPTGQWRAGAVRNAAIDLVESPWVGLLDDDDTICPNYVETHMKMINDDSAADIFLYKMLNQDGRTLPDVPDLRCNHVGISFAFRKRVFEKVKFRQMKCEDLDFLRTARVRGFRIKFADAVLYRVKQ
jgi:glycosyltransferase involved in cell wall biosynthesis